MGRILLMWLALSACALAQVTTKTLTDPNGKCLILESGADTGFLEALGVPPYPGAAAYRMNLAASAEASGETITAEAVAAAEKLMRQVVFETSDPLSTVRAWVVRHFVGWQVRPIETRAGVRGFEASSADDLANLMAFDYQRDGLRYIMLVDTSRMMAAMNAALAARGGDAVPSRQLPPGLSRDLASYAIGLPDDPALTPAGAVVNERDGSVLVPIDLHDAQVAAFGGEPDVPGEGVLGDRPRFHCGLAAYAIGLHEVTNAQYARFVAATGHRAPRSWLEGAVPAGLERHPVVEVSHLDASEACDQTDRPTRANQQGDAQGARGGSEYGGGTAT